ncbi:MAG: protein-ADP-ribose hydrolase [Lachnospiraceae bacterium]|nr:protein-ADP-ribose hydrolase [Lachnospiraceae bacterium]
MNQSERREYLIRYLLAERAEYEGVEVPKDTISQKTLLRALFNVRMPQTVTDEFLQIQGDYLQEEIRQKGITDYKNLLEIQPDLYLWQGDISTLKCGAIVNAANSQMLGCFRPNHTCIDNCIHTFAGIQLRRDCYEIMRRQGHEEPTGTAKITLAYNLPCDYVLHTVGPIVSDEVTKRHEDQLSSCYLACLKLADQREIASIAFCCISTGVFRFPNERAAEIAVQTVKEYKIRTGSDIKVIFNVFKDMDMEIYRKILQ